MSGVVNGWREVRTPGGGAGSGAARPHPVLAPPVSLAGNPEPGNIAVTAVIDDGIGIGHARFRDAVHSSRIAYAWFQDGVTPPGSPVLYGREFAKAEIDGLLSASDDGVSVDEDRFYRTLAKAGLKDGHPGVLARRATHGTHVLDLAAGGNGAENPIIAVQLPRDVTEDTSGQQLTEFAEDALRYIVDRADRIAALLGAAELPLVINFSYGFIAGPHDGTHPLERVMEDILAARNAAGEKTAIVLPAGNSRESRCHARLTFAAAGAAKELEWRVQPDDRTPSHVEIHMPYSAGPPATSRISARLTAPGGAAVSPDLAEVDGLAWEWPATGPVRARIGYRYQAGATGRGRFLASLAPTRDLLDAAGQAPPGTWRITLTNAALGPAEQVHAYVQRDDTPFGHERHGRQSRFEDAAYHLFTPQGGPVEQDAGTGYLRRAGLINGMGTGAATVVMAGYDRRSGRPALYSSGGPVQPAGGAGQPGRSGPDAMAVSDTSRAHRGVLGSATRSGRLVALAGTSVAAPQMARRIAAAMIAGTWAGKATLAGWAQHGTAHRPPDYPPPVGALRGGDGWILHPPVHERARIWR
ncbi:MAG: hypothetical protein ACE5FS_09130 [Paracoccaceae bacterium]